MASNESRMRSTWLVAGQSESEIGMYRRYSDYCGYVFFVMCECGK